MKKVLLLFIIFSTLFLIGCGNNKSKYVILMSGDTIKNNVVIENKLAKELKIEVMNSMESNNSFISFDKKYAEEYIRILSEYGKEATCYTYLLENTIFPLLIVKEGKDFYVYEYENGIASDVTEIGRAHV